MESLSHGVPVFRLIYVTLENFITLPLTGTTVVTITVQDFNDCPPEFANNIPGSVGIAEGEGNGSILVTFEVNDCDSGDNGVNGTRFTIIAGKLSW